MKTFFKTWISCGLCKLVIWIWFGLWKVGSAVVWGVTVRETRGTAEVTLTVSAWRTASVLSKAWLLHCCHVLSQRWSLEQLQHSWMHDIMKCGKKDAGLPRWFLRTLPQPLHWYPKARSAFILAMFYVGKSESPFARDSCPWISGGDSWGCLLAPSLLSRPPSGPMFKVLSWPGWSLSLSTTGFLWEVLDLLPSLSTLRTVCYLKVARVFQHDFGMTADSCSPLFSFRVLIPFSMTNFSCVVSTARIRVYCHRYVILPLKLLAHAFLGKLLQMCSAATEILSFLKLQKG